MHWKYRSNGHFTMPTYFSPTLYILRIYFSKEQIIFRQILSQVSKFQHHTQLRSKCNYLFVSSLNLSMFSDEKILLLLLSPSSFFFVFFLLIPLSSSSSFFFLLLLSSFFFFLLLSSSSFFFFFLFLLSSSSFFFFFFLLRRRLLLLLLLLLLQNFIYHGNAGFNFPCIS